MSDGLSAAVLDQTRRFWECRTGEAVSSEDAAEAVRGIAGFFDLLARWAGEADAPSASGAESGTSRSLAHAYGENREPPPGGLHLDPS